MSRDDELKTMTDTQEEDNITDKDMGTYVKFSKPYTFEDDVYEGVDLSGLSNLTGRNLNNIEKRFYKLGIASFNPENTVAYAQVVAQEATGLPIEYLHGASKHNRISTSSECEEVSTQVHEWNLKLHRAE